MSCGRAKESGVQYVFSSSIYHPCAVGERADGTNVIVMCVESNVGTLIPYLTSIWTSLRSLHFKMTSQEHQGQLNDYNKYSNRALIWHFVSWTSVLPGPARILWLMVFVHSKGSSL